MDVADLVHAVVVKRFARSPVLHFLVLGALLHAVSSWRAVSAGVAARSERAKTIVVSAAEVENLRRGWVVRTGRLPSTAEERQLLDKTIDDELLYREALAAGLDRGDAVVRNRLIELARFLSPESRGDEESLHREALELGLDRSDVIVRRHLIQTMELLARRPNVPQPVTDAELQALLDREADAFRIPAEVTLTHVFLSESRRGAAVERDAARLLERLRADDVDPASARSLGDPFLLGSRVASASDRDLERKFGAAFAKALAGVAAGRWEGPVRSSYGAHLVWVHARRPSRMPTLDSVRTRVFERLREERGAERLRRRLAELRTRYAVRVEAPAESPVVTVSSPPPGSAVTLPRPRPFLGD
ncbi:MAG: peptidyl-prolyl cis-trans isomerase [Candidatus Binatia bacterium]